MHLKFRNRRRILNGPEPVVHYQQVGGFYAKRAQKANPKVGQCIELLIALGVVLQALERLGGQGDAVFGALLGAFGVLGGGLLHRGVDVAAQVRAHGFGADLGVSDFLQVDLAQVLLPGGKHRGGQHRGGDEQSSQCGTLHGDLLDCRGSVLPVNRTGGRVGLSPFCAGLESGPWPGAGVRFFLR